MKKPVRSILGATAIAAAGSLLLPAAQGAASPAVSAQQATRSADPISGGWFGSWTSASAIEEVARDSDGALDEVNIFWWYYGGSNAPVRTTTDWPVANATPWTNANLSAAVTKLHEHDVTVFATHTDLYYGNARSLSNYLATAEHRQAIANKLTNWAVRAGVDGIDLDWENFAFNDGSSTWSATRPRLNDTIRRLAAALHAEGKLLAVTVPGGDQPFLSSGAPNPGGGYWVYQWRTLAKHADRLRLMAYDYSWNRPGPIGPHSWAKQVVRSAVAQVGSANKHKIHIGVHQYGKAWYDRDGSDDYITVGRCNDAWRPSGSDAVGLSPTGARDLAKTYGVTPRFDNDSREWTFTYRKKESGYWYTPSGQRRTKTCTVQKEAWFGGKETAAGRGELVRDYGIGGVAVWQLGSLDTGYFPALDATMGTGTKAAVRRMKISVSDTTPAVGDTVTVRGRVVPSAAGVTVQRQRRTGGAWALMSTTTTGADGRVSFPVTIPEGMNVIKLRLRVPNAQGKVVSRVITLRPHA